MDYYKPRITIDEQKNVIIPEELKKHIVQRDHNVKTLIFDCPRYSDGRDLSTMLIYINYLRADKKKGSAPAKNISVDPGNMNIIHFEWSPEIDATESFGILTFLVYAEKSDADGNLENAWHTKLCKDLHISEGLDCLKEVGETYSAIITHLLTQMQSTREELEKKLNKDSFEEITVAELEAWYAELSSDTGIPNSEIRRMYLETVDYGEDRGISNEEIRAMYF